MWQKRRNAINRTPRKLSNCTTVSGIGKYVPKTLLRRSWKFPQGAEGKKYYIQEVKAITAVPFIHSELRWGMPALRLCRTHALQNLSFESLTAEHLYTYLFLSAWYIWGVNGPKIDWFNELQFSSLTFIFFYKLKKGSAVTHPKGVRKVKPILKILRKKNGFKGGTQKNAHKWRWRIFILHSIL